MCVQPEIINNRSINRHWMTFYKYRYNEIIADQGWKIVLMVGNIDAKPRLDRYSFHQVYAKRKQKKLKQAQRQHKKTNKKQRASVSNSDSNSSLNMIESHWILRYRYILGNKRFIARLLTISIFIIPTFIVTFAFLYSKYVSGVNIDPRNKENRDDWLFLIIGWINMVLTFLFIIFFIYLEIFETNKFSDLLNIRYEIRSAAISMGLLLMFTFIWSFITNDIEIEWTWMAYFMSFSILLSYISFIIITRVIHKYNKLQLQRKLSIAINNSTNLNSHSHSNSNSIGHGLETIKLFPYLFCNCFCTSNSNSNSNSVSATPTAPMSTLSSQTKKDMRNTKVENVNISIGRSISTSYGEALNQLLSHEIGYSLFMRYLVSEWSVENLLFITEINQFKKSKIFENIIISNDHDDDVDDDINSTNNNVNTKHAQLSLKPSFLNLRSTSVSASIDTRYKHAYAHGQDQLKVNINKTRKGIMIGKTDDDYNVLNINSASAVPIVSRSPSISTSRDATVATVATVATTDRDANENHEQIQMQRTKMNVIEFPELAVENIPQSKIMKENNIFSKIRLIMKYYVDENAPLRINLSHKMYGLLEKKLDEIDAIEKELQLNDNNNGNNNNDRHGDVNQMDNDTLCILYSVFDEPTKQIFRFVSRSFGSFSQTDVCYILMYSYHVSIVNFPLIISMSYKIDLYFNCF